MDTYGTDAMMSGLSDLADGRLNWRRLTEDELDDYDRAVSDAIYEGVAAARRVVVAAIDAWVAEHPAAAIALRVPENPAKLA